MQKNQRLLYNQYPAEERLTKIHLPLMFSDNVNTKPHTRVGGMCISSQYQMGYDIIKCLNKYFVRFYTFVFVQIKQTRYRHLLKV